MSKLFVEQFANGNKTTVSEWSDNEQGAIIAFHNLCRALWNDAPTTKALVEISDEQFNTFGGFREDIDKTQPEPEVPGKLYVMQVANGNLDVENITEWVANNNGIKGAMVDYHGKCAAMWNDETAISANIKVLNEHLDTWNGKSEYIAHSSEE